MNEEKMITLTTPEGEQVEFYVLEETRISGMNYLLVTDSAEEDEEGECYILKDRSRPEEEEVQKGITVLPVKSLAFTKLLVGQAAMCHQMG